MIRTENDYGHESGGQEPETFEVGRIGMVANLKNLWAFCYIDYCFFVCTLNFPRIKGGNYKSNTLIASYHLLKSITFHHRQVT